MLIFLLFCAFYSILHSIFKNHFDISKLYQIKCFTWNIYSFSQSPLVKLRNIILLPQVYSCCWISSILLMIIYFSYCSTMFYQCFTWNIGFCLFISQYLEIFVFLRFDTAFSLRYAIFCIKTYKSHFSLCYFAFLCIVFGEHHHLVWICECFLLFCIFAHFCVYFCVFYVFFSCFVYYVSPLLSILAIYSYITTILLFGSSKRSFLKNIRSHKIVCLNELW